MKYSDAMLKGFKKVNGRNCRHVLAEGGDREPTALCVNGAANYGRNGSPYSFTGLSRAHTQFMKAWGFMPHVLNNNGLPWEEIYGMARAAGL